MVRLSYSHGDLERTAKGLPLMLFLLTSRASSGSCQRMWLVAGDEPHPAVKLGANGTTACQVDLTGRATSVPFTGVIIGS
jgi:hypothetical protein